jgi:hypothetical protein
MEAVRDQMVYNEHLIHASDVISVRLAVSVLGISDGFNIRSAYIIPIPISCYTNPLIPAFSLWRRFQ